MIIPRNYYFGELICPRQSRTNQFLISQVWRNYLYITSIVDKERSHSLLTKVLFLYFLDPEILGQEIPPHKEKLTSSFHYANMKLGFHFENIMHLISAGKLKQSASKYPDASKPIQAFCKIIRQAQWLNLIDVQQVYRNAEAVGSFTVFNIKGNKYRLILDIDYTEQVAYFKYFLTHAQYDQDKWKNDPYY